MKLITDVVKVIAFVLNLIFLAFLLLVVQTKGASPSDFLDWAALFLMFLFPPLMLAILAFTFFKKKRIFCAVLKVVSIIVNISMLIVIILEFAGLDLEDLHLWMWFLVAFVLGLPALNLLVIVLTFLQRPADLMPKPAL